MVRQRIEWIDAAKGFAMLLIIWDHVFLIESPLKLWLTSFHVPLFLVLTGFLLDPATNNKTNGKTLINKLGVRLYAIIGSRVIQKTLTPKASLFQVSHF